MSRIFVCPLSALDETLERSQAKTMMAFGSPDAALERPAQIEQHLALRFNDIAEPREGLQEPTREHVSQLIAFADGWDRNTPLIAQCWMGVSRSTAAAAIVAARVRPDLAPQAIAGALRTASPIATPNPLMIAHADELLGFEGSLRRAISAIGRGAEAREGMAFVLDTDSL